MLKKPRYISVLLLISLLILTSISCGDDKPTKEETKFTQAELEKIAKDSLSAMNEAKTYKISADIAMITDIDAGTGSEKIKLDISMDAVFDKVNKETLLTMNMESSVDPDTQNLSAEMYLFPDYIYMKANMDNVDEMWMKIPSSDEVKEVFSIDSLEEEFKVLESSTDLKFIRYETFGGSECYVIEFVPDDDYLLDYAHQQQNGEFEVAWDKVKDVSDIYSSIVYKVWIATDTKYLLKMETSVRLNFEETYLISDSFDSITLDGEGTMVFSNYNDPVSITLPEEASEAMEVPSEVFN